jgi:hypothetical protein
MPTSDFHAQNTAPLFVGIAAIVSGIFTPSFIVTFMCAVMGSGIGMAFLPAPSPIKSRIDLMMRFTGNLIYVFLTSVVIMFAMYYLKSRIGGADYPLAFFSAMAFMLFRDKLISALGNFINRKIDGA